MATADEKHFSKASLLGMAPEIRLRIYQCVFHESKVLITLDSDKTREYSRNLTSYHYAITQVNSLLRRESLTLLRMSTTLFIRTEDIFCNDAHLSCLPHGLPPSIDRISVDDTAVNSLPLDELTNLKCVSVRFMRIAFRNQDESTLNGRILKTVTEVAAHGFFDDGVAEFRHQLAAKNKSIRTLCTVFLWPASGTGESTRVSCHVLLSVICADYPVHSMP